MKRAVFLPMILALAATADLSFGQAASNHASIRAGRAIATSSCIVCHTLSPDQAIKPIYGGKAPPFAEIANRPGTSRESLLAFLNSPHWNDPLLPIKPGPMLLISQREKSDVAVYILSLRKPQ